MYLEKDSLLKLNKGCIFRIPPLCHDVWQKNSSLAWWPLAIVLGHKDKVHALWCLLRICCFQGKRSRNKAPLSCWGKRICSYSLQSSTFLISTWCWFYKGSWQQWETRLFRFFAIGYLCLAFRVETRELLFNSLPLLPWVEYNPSSSSMRASFILNHFSTSSTFCLHEIPLILLRKKIIISHKILNKL